MQVQTFYSNGKLLLTGEYVVLDGAKSLAIPTMFGQSLQVDKIKEPILLWESFDSENRLWFNCKFLLSDLLNDKNEFFADTIQKTLLQILLAAKKLNPAFINTSQGYHIKTHLNFPRNWGLGTSSTLINNIAQWAKVDAFLLLQNSFGGSGYDIACAQNDTPISYQLIENKPIVKNVNFQPKFTEQLFFVHLNQKQDSKEGIKKYKRISKNNSSFIKHISHLTNQIILCDSLPKFESLIKEHEEQISTIIQKKTIQEKLFSDYFGQTKSLGAWGGDFILATGNANSPNYFKNKGYQTVIPFKKMVK